MGIFLSGRWDSNPRHSAWKADVLPLNYTRVLIYYTKHFIHTQVRHSKSSG